jgi:hypothetical protein
MNGVKRHIATICVPELMVESYPTNANDIQLDHKSESDMKLSLATSKISKLIVLSFCSWTCGDKNSIGRQEQKESSLIRYETGKRRLDGQYGGRTQDLGVISTTL